MMWRMTLATGDGRLRPAKGYWAKRQLLSNVSSLRPIAAHAARNMVSLTALRFSSISSWR